jgi:hypothetical protein
MLHEKTPSFHILMMVTNDKIPFFGTTNKFTIFLTVFSKDMLKKTSFA